MDTTIFGITKKELEVYQYLLQHPQKHAADIAIGLNIQRPNTYDLIKNLLSKGLITYTNKGKIKHYIAVHPRKLKEIYEFEKVALQQKEEQVDSFVLQCLQNRQENSSSLQVKFYEGLKGMRTLLLEAVEESRKTKKEMLAVRLNKENLPELDKTYTERFFMLRRKHTLVSRYILLEGTPFYNDSLVRVKIMPNKFSTPVGVYLYGNTTSFWLFPQKETILAIENKEITDTMRVYFELLWSIGK